MSRIKFPIFLAIALAALAWTTAPAAAALQFRGGRGGSGWRGGGGWYGGGWGGYRGGWYGGGYRNYGFGLGGYYPYYRWGYGGYYPYYGYSNYYYPTYAYDSASLAYVYPQPPGIITRGAGSYAPTDNTAMIHLRVPGDATVWVEGERTQQTGTERDFVSPPLDPGKDYSYRIKARWTEDGKPIEKTKKVMVHANETSNVDFLSAARAD
jgi:uncharacterized protein (TIGR03000 family)